MPRRASASSTRPAAATSVIAATTQMWPARPQHVHGCAPVPATRAVPLTSPRECHVPCQALQASNLHAHEHVTNHAYIDTADGGGIDVGQGLFVHDVLRVRHLRVVRVDARVGHGDPQRQAGKGGGPGGSGGDSERAGLRTNSSTPLRLESRRESTASSGTPLTFGFRTPSVSELCMAGRHGVGFKRRQAYPWLGSCPGLPGYAWECRN